MSSSRCGVPSATRGVRPCGCSELQGGPREGALGLRCEPSRRLARIAATSADGLLDVVVHDDGVELGRRQRLLGLGLAEPALESAPAISRAPRLEPAPLLRAGRRPARTRAAASGNGSRDRQRALDVDLEQHVVARRRARSTTDCRGVPFRSPYTSNHSRKPPASRSALELVPGHEAVVDAVDLARRAAARVVARDRPARASGRARSSRATIVPLPTPDGPGEDEQDACRGRSGAADDLREWLEQRLRAGCGRARGAAGSR